MAKHIKDLKLALGENLEEKLRLLEPNFDNYRILKKSVDARTRQKLHWVYSVELFSEGETPKDLFDPPPPVLPSQRPLIVGTGPAGLFAAIRLAERGVPCDLFERGSVCEKRILAINKYWRYGEMNEEDNVCFGEGGAGLYSDGKLITRIKSPHIPYVMKRLVDFGAPPEVEYSANPHIGSNKIRRLIPKMRDYLIKKGCRIFFNTKVTEFIFENNQMTGLKTQGGEEFRSDFIVVATGHSAEDIFHELQRHEVDMEGKSFAVGLRVEHPQGWVNKTQYRQHSDHPELGAANYKLTWHNKEEDVGVYSFCMCPGGYVLSSGTDKNGVVSNGMSNYNRNSPYANAAIVVSIDHQKNFGEDLFGGLKFRRDLETRAFESVQKQGGGHRLPAQNMMDFMLNQQKVKKLEGSSPSGLQASRLDQLFPPTLYNHMIEAFEKFQNKMDGFIDSHATLYGVESRTSCPVRVCRDGKTFESTSHSGLYPCGEGAGYAGGITSAACDGIRVADAIAQKMASQHLAQSV